MKTVCLHPSAVFSNCNMISWSFPAEEFANDIQKLISRYDFETINCGKHNYLFNLLPNNPSTIPFGFPETNSLMQLIQEESDHFYIKAAIREFLNTFIVLTSKGDRLYPEDIE
jgi:hypothetical protein